MPENIAPSQIQRQYHFIIILLSTLCILVFVAIIGVLFLLTNDSSESSSLENKLIEYNSFVTYKLEPIENLVFSCRSLAEKNLTEKYCSTFKNVNVSGISTFLGCDSNPIKRSISENISIECSLEMFELRKLCDEKRLADEQFIGVRNIFTTCSQIRYYGVDSIKDYV